MRIQNNHVGTGLVAILSLFALVGCPDAGTVPTNDAAESTTDGSSTAEATPDNSGETTQSASTEVSLESLNPQDYQSLLAEHQGKVVVIDFWATWCGPCLREFPNVAEQYELYHDKGFEVVGISVDDDREALLKFLESRDIPWTTLHGATPETLGWNHPAAIRYGVMAIPTVILVDQEGIVVSLQARGKFLGMHLKKLLGPPRVEPVEAERPVDVAGVGE